jgi:hypothetical protein
MPPRRARPLRPFPGMLPHLVGNFISEGEHTVKLPEARQTAYTKKGELTVKLPEARQNANTNFGDLSVKLPEARQTANSNEGEFMAAPGTPGYVRARGDEPHMSFTRRGCKAVALSAAVSATANEDALHVLRRDQDAATSVASRDSMLRTWIDLHGAWFPDTEPFPLTSEKIMAVGAMLKKGGYRSA